MTTSSPLPNNDFSSLAEDAKALLAATADMAGDQVGEARKRLTAALESGKKMVGCVKDKAVEGAKATDKAIHDHPYVAIGVAAGAGVIIGYLLSRRLSRKCD